MRTLFVLLFLSTIVATAQEKILPLEEVVLVGQRVPTHHKQKAFRGKKYFTRLSSRNIAMVSSYTPSQDAKVSGVKFYFDTSQLETEQELLFIRPLFFSQTMQSLLPSSQTFVLNVHSREVVFDFSEQPITINANQNYFIGFEVLDEKNTYKVLGVRVVNQKGTYSLLKITGESHWLPERNANYGYTCDYVLYLQK